MKFAVDTNVLVGLAEDSTGREARAFGELFRLCGQQNNPILLPQMLVEFWSVATRPRGENGLGLNTTQADRYLDHFLEFFDLEPDRPGVFTAWRRLVSK